MNKKLVILSGPSCVGKGPLRRVLAEHHPEIKFAELVLCNSRRPRKKKDTGIYEVHGIDFYFLPKALFGQFDPIRFVVGNVRSDVQAIDMLQVQELLENNNLVLAEVFHTLGKTLTDWAKSQVGLDFEVRSVFLSPLSEDELKTISKESIRPPSDVVYEVMKAKLERRGEDSSSKIKERARSAFIEMQDAPHYTDCIINHAGEDDQQEWGDPLGPEAERVLKQFVEVLTGKT